MNFNMHLYPFVVQVIECQDGILCSFTMHCEYGRMWLKDEKLPKDAKEPDVRRACAQWCNRLLKGWRQGFDARYVAEVPPVGS